jgi:hypothetical protein
MNLDVVTTYKVLMAGQLNEVSYFRREMDEHCALLGYYATFSGNS